MLNVIKSKAPDGDFRYNDPEIKQLVKDDFYGICYVCEEYVPVHSEIDHFFPQIHFPELENEWANLFYICQKCNKHRPRNINTKGHEVLNNCEDDVEKLIKLKLTENRVEISSDKDSEKVKNTIRLLHRIYNGVGAKKKSSVARLEDIKTHTERFRELLNKYKKAKQLFEDLVIRNLSKMTKTTDSTYISFKRQLIEEDSNLHHLRKYFD